MSPSPQPIASVHAGRVFFSRGREHEGAAGRFVHFCAEL
jgi:hypothetical protein